MLVIFIYLYVCYLTFILHFLSININIFSYIFIDYIIIFFILIFKFLIFLLIILYSASSYDAVGMAL